MMMTSMEGARDENNQELIEILKIEKKEQDEQIKELIKREKYQNETIAMI